MIALSIIKKELRISKYYWQFTYDNLLVDFSFNYLFFYNDQWYYLQNQNYLLFILQLSTLEKIRKSDAKNCNINN